MKSSPVWGLGFDVVARVIVWHLGGDVLECLLDTEDRVDGKPFDTGGLLGALCGSLRIDLGVEPALSDCEARASNPGRAGGDISFLVELLEPAVKAACEGLGALLDLCGGEPSLLTGAFLSRRSNARWSQ